MNPQPGWFKPQTLLDKIFEASVAIKGVEGVLETLAGVAVLIAGTKGLNRFLEFITHKELREDSHDFIANFILHSGEKLAGGGTTYLVAYLIINGLIKLLVVIGLLRNELWAYPVSLGTLGLFMLYQIYRLALGHSVAVLLLTLYDVFLLWLIWREYQVQKQRRQTAAA